VNSFTKKTVQENLQTTSAKKGFSHLSVLFGFAVTLLLLGGFVCYYLAAQNNPVPPPSASSEKIVSKENPADDSVANKDTVQEQDGKPETPAAKEIMYGDGVHMLPVKIRRASIEKALQHGRFYDNNNNEFVGSITDCMSPEYGLIYEPAWVKVFGTITKGQNYSHVHISGNRYVYKASYGVPEEAMRDWNVIRNHIFDNSNFYSAVIEQFAFINCSFKKANFTNARLLAVVMRDCDFTDAIFSGISFEMVDDDGTRFENDLSTVKGLTWKQIKQTCNYVNYERSGADAKKEGFVQWADMDVKLPPDIQKALDEESKKKTLSEPNKEKGEK
jgi:hypothetical protein